MYENAVVSFSIEMIKYLKDFINIKLETTVRHAVIKMNQHLRANQIGELNSAGVQDDLQIF